MNLLARLLREFRALAQYDRPFFSVLECDLFGAEVEYPSSDEAAQDWNVGHDDSDIVLDVVDTVVNWIGPVRNVESVEPVTVREIDFCSADGSHCQTACEDGQNDKSRPQPRAHHSPDNDEWNW